MLQRFFCITDINKIALNIAIPLFDFKSIVANVAEGQIFGVILLREVILRMLIAIIRCIILFFCHKIRGWHVDIIVGEFA